MKLFFKLVLAFTMFSALGAGSAQAAGPSCNDIFSGNKGSNKSEAEQEQMVSRIAKSGQNTWVAYERYLEKRVEGKMNPLWVRSFSADAIGQVHADFAKEFPYYHNYYQFAKQTKISLNDFLGLREAARRTIDPILRNKNATDIQLFAALEVARQMSIIQSLTDFPPPKEDPKKKEEEEKKKEEEQKKKEKKEPKDPPPPKWDDLPDDYKPHNKDLANDSDEATKAAHDMIKTTEGVYKHLFHAKIFDVVTAEKFSSSPLIRPEGKNVSHPKAVGHVKYLTAGSAKFSLPTQYGYEPIPGRYKGFNVVETYPGEFEAQITDSHLTEIEIPLMQVRSFAFTKGNTEKHYSAPTGVNKNSWPQEIRDYMASLKKQNLNPLQIAEAIEKYLSIDGGFLYFSKGDKIDEAHLNKLKAEFERLKKQYPEPVALAHLKSFNCDGAAWIGAILLKDFFGIPTRVAGGRTEGGHKMVNGTKYYVSKSSSPLHAWTEVWDGQHWVPFDMTPKENNPENKSQSENDLQNEEENQDQESSDSDQQQQQQQQGKEGKDSKDKSKDKENKDGKESKGKDSKDGKDKEAKDGKESKDGKDKEGKDGKEGKEGKDQKGGKEDKDGDKEGAKEGGGDREIESRLNIQKKQDVSKHGGKSVKNPQDALHQSAMTYMIEGLISRAQRRTLLSGIESFTKNPDNMASATLYQSHRQGTQFFMERMKRAPDKNLPEIMVSVKNNLISGQLTKSYEILNDLKSAIQNLSQFRDLTKQEVDFSMELSRVLSHLKTLNHPDAQSYEIVHRVVQKLPGIISKDWIRSKYGDDYLSLGALSQKKLASDIAKGNLKPIVRMSLLGEYAQMVLNSERVPNYKDMKTLMRNPVPKNNKDLVIARSPLELTRMLLNPVPGEHMFAPLVEGRQFAVGDRLTIKVSDPKQPIERKISVVYYDISGSMSGEPLEIVDALLMNFVDSALSEKDPFGKPVHEVILVPFDDKLHQAIDIKTREEAMDFISRKVSHTTTSAGGTDIQKVLLNFYDVVAEAHKKTEKEPLARRLKKANMILFSDGGSTVDKATVDKARQQVSSAVTLNMNFVGIGNSNETLIELAKMSNQQQANAMYRDITHEMMSEVSAAASKTEYNPDAYASDQRLSNKGLADLSQMTANVPTFSSTPNEALVRQLQSKLNFNENAAKNMKDPGFVTMLIALTKDVTSMDLPRQIRMGFIERLLVNYPQLSGRPLNALTLKETENLNKLVEWAFQGH